MPIARDGCVVDSEPLGAIIRDYVNRWDGDSIASHTGVHAAIAALAQRTEVPGVPDSGVPAGTIDNIARTPPRYKTTELRVADAIVTALGRPDLLYGTLTIKPNPCAPREARAACCGGSNLNGSLT